MLDDFTMIQRGFGSLIGGFDMKCDECGEKLLTNPIDRDRCDYIYCRRCGLVFEPTHPMGKGIRGLIIWAKGHGASIDTLREIARINRTVGLREARLHAAKIIGFE